MSESFDIENFPTSESALKMLSYVSDGFYDNSYVGKWLYQVMGLEHDSVLEILETLPEQMFPETATWGLMYHEIKWGLPVRENLSYEERRKLIYQKRDYRAPMTPHRMEVLLSDLSGCTVYINDIHSIGDDGYVPEHPNVFRVTLQVGSDPVDLGGVLQKLSKVKQSHTTFTFRVTTAARIIIGVEPKAYRVIHRLCGTFPKVSTGWRLLTSGIDLDVAAGGTKSEPPLSGVSGETGQYPKTSTGLKITNDLVELQPSGKGQGVKYALTGEGEAGQFPQTSTGFVRVEGGVIAEASVQGDRVAFTFTGTEPKQSTGYASVSGGIIAESHAEGNKTEYVAAGTAPGVSTGAGSAANSLVPGVTTESFKVTYPMCGSAFEI